MTTERTRDRGRPGRRAGRRWPVLGAVASVAAVVLLAAQVTGAAPAHADDGDLPCIYLASATMSVSPSTITSGQTVALSWNVSNPCGSALTMSGPGFGGAGVFNVGSVALAPTVDSMWTLTVWSRDTGASLDLASASVHVVPPQTTGPLTPPDLRTLNTFGGSLYVGWYDQSVNETAFQIFRRDVWGGFQLLHQQATGSGPDIGGAYSWLDTDRSMSGQCYIVVALNTTASAVSNERCTVLANPSVFPDRVPTSALLQWRGFSGVNDGTGPLTNVTRGADLYGADQTFGVDLDWKADPSLWRIEAQGTPIVMTGQAVALRVWGGGWLRYGHQDWGVDLQLSSTPSYEWHVVGSGQPNAGYQLVGAATYALWNSAARDYLVTGHQTYGVDLDWFQKTQ